MLTSFEAKTVADYRADEDIAPQKILRSGPEAKLRHLLCITIESRSSVASPIQQEAWESLDSGLKRSLHDPLVSKLCVLTVWIVPRQSIATLEQNCLSHIRKALLNRSQPHPLQHGETGSQMRNIRAESLKNNCTPFLDIDQPREYDIAGYRTNSRPCTTSFSLPWG